MGLFLLLPIEVRLGLLFIVGLFLGSLINWAIYQICWNPRLISPWSKPHDEASKRHWSDRIPVMGWLGLAREGAVHGSWFWIRPMLIELVCGMGLAWMYLWETVDHGLHAWDAAVLGGPVAPQIAPVLHQQFLAHAILFAFLVAATFIDFDEKTIPDLITIPGTMIGLLLAGLLPASLISDFVVVTPPGGAPALMPTSLRLALPWPPWLNGSKGLLIGILCLVGWWYALLPKVFYFRGGIAKGLRLLFAKMTRYRESLYLTIVLAAAVIYTIAIWSLGGTNWAGLLSALVGMAFGGAIVWGFRIVASAALGQEAMGFGDVTLMAMIGAYLGWQPILIVFFIAPFAGMIIAVVQWILTRKHEIAYGPYLAFGAMVLIFNWPWIWMRSFRHFTLLGWWIPGILLVCLGLTAVMLTVWMAIKRRIFSD